MELKQWNDILAVKTSAGQYLGYHTQTLDVAELSEEIWNGISNQTLEQDADAFEQLKAWNEESNSDAPIGRSIDPKIQSISINVTQVCNLHCVYCGAGGDGTYGSPQNRISVDKTLPQLKFLMEKLSPGDKFGITFIGGEPLLFPKGILAIAEYANEFANTRGINLKYSLTTNGTLFNEATLEILKVIKPNITVSLDGDAKINDMVRPTKTTESSTEKVLEGLRLILENRAELGTIGIQGVYGKHNTDVLGAYRFFRELNVDWYEFSFDHECSDPTISQNYTNSLISAAELALSTGGEFELKKIKTFSYVFDHLDSKKKIDSYCGSGKSYLSIDSKNNVFTCPWAVNDPKEAVGKGIDLEMNRLQPYRKPLVLENNCQSCWAKYLCGGGCMWAHKMTTGNRHTPDPTYCKRTRSLISTAISYYYNLRKEVL